MEESSADAVVFAESLIGLTVIEARKIAARRGYKVRDWTPLGWYTNEKDRWRINVTTDDAGRISTAVQG